MQQLIGKINQVIFSKKEAGYFVFRLSLESGGDSVVVGTFPEVPISEGLKVRANGSFTTHEKFGKQFQANSCEIIPEKGKVGVVSYLIANVPSIGIITANRLYDKFGDELVEILSKDPEKVRECDFLKKSQIDSIIAEWSSSSERRTASILLTDFGLNVSQIKSVFSKFGVETTRIIQNNPYKLTECAGVGFLTADQVARRVGIGVDDVRRIRAMITFSLREISFSEGHVCSTSSQVIEFINKLIKKGNAEPFSHGEFVSESNYYSCLIDLEKSGDVKIENNDIYLSIYHHYESESAECLAKILATGPTQFKNFDSCVEEFESINKINLSDEQKQAFHLLKESRVCAISGYPGTGKTLLMSLFVHLFKKENIDYVLLSPTGIAAKRLSQLTREPAYTIHRALGCNREGTWEFGKHNKYRVSAVILDETSMVSIDVFYRLVTALPSNTMFVIVGDDAQLPSVGPGAVLKSLLNCSDVPHVRLTKIFRQEGESGIIKAAHSIVRGEKVDLSFDQKNEFLFFKLKDDQIMQELSKISSELKLRNSNFQIIAPVYDGNLGVNNLNRELRKVLNSEFSSDKATKLKHGDSDLYEGDRIMITKNDYDRMIFNGDTGKIQKIKIKDGVVEAKIFNWFDQETSKYIDKIFQFTLEEVRQLVRVSYACTVHKSQGQEHDYVILPMTMTYSNMLYRNLLYTAITRARKKVFLFGDPRAFELSIMNIRESVRNSNLSNKISESLKDVLVEQVINN